MSMPIQRQSESFGYFDHGPRYERDRASHDLPKGLAALINTSGPRIQAGLMDTRSAGYTMGDSPFSPGWGPRDHGGHGPDGGPLHPPSYYDDDDDEYNPDDELFDSEYDPDRFIPESDVDPHTAALDPDLRARYAAHIGSRHPFDREAGRVTDWLRNGETPDHEVPWEETDEGWHHPQTGMKIVPSEDTSGHWQLIAPSVGDRGMVKLRSPHPDPQAIMDWQTYAMGGPPPEGHQPKFRDHIFPPSTIPSRQAARLAMPTYYHVAPRRSVDSIRQHGLDYTKGEAVWHHDGTTPGNYFWDHPGYAEQYAEELDERDRQEYGSMNWKEEDGHTVLPFDHDGPALPDPENEWNDEMEGRSFYSPDPIPASAFHAPGKHLESRRVALAPQDPAMAPQMPAGGGFLPAHRVGLPWRDTIIPGTVISLDGDKLGVRWDDGQYTSEHPHEVRLL